MQIVAQKSDALISKFKTLCSVGDFDPRDRQISYPASNEWVQGVERWVQELGIRMQRPTPNGTKPVLCPSVAIC